MEVRVRFAPSPTGFFSIGNARTALFNYIFAKHEKGKFLLRIEDTDKERSKEEYTQDIIEGLNWLGFIWDEEIIKQSERLDIYEKHLKKLIEEKKAYYCFCTPQELEAERQAQLSAGFLPKYSGRCKNIPLEEALKRAEKENYVIRIKMPSYEVNFQDLVRGKINFNLDLIGDVIIAKNLRSPLYNFAVVIDDHEMQISHVIRGEDHISNTPIQIALYNAFSWEKPQFAHLPLILGPDRKKLSKRYLDASMKDFRKMGYLKEAMINFLALLGWHPTVDKEIVSLEEIIKDFNFKKVQKSGAVFNEEKLKWLNNYYIKNLPFKDIYEKIKSFVPQDWLQNEEKLIKALEISRERMKTLKDFEEIARFFFQIKEYDPELLIWANTPITVILDNLSFLLNVIKGIPNQELWTKENIQKYIMSVAETRGKGEILWPLRVALSGEKNSPSPIEILYVLGKEESLRRIEKAIEKINQIKK
jgi:glutamyl-tRNA synthetase